MALSQYVLWVQTKRMNGCMNAHLVLQSIFVIVNNSVVPLLEAGPLRLPKHLIFAILL